MKYQELIPETNILALIVHEIICSGLNQSYKHDLIITLGYSFFHDFLSKSSESYLDQPDSDSAIFRQI